MTHSDDSNLSKLERTFLDLAAIDEVYPHESKVLTYIEGRLKQAGLAPARDAAGNIVAEIAGEGVPLALVGHVDIAAPLGDRQSVIDADKIKTDGTGILGADDKAAVAIMLELADVRRESPQGRALELIFTTGEEAGCVGAVQLEMSRVKAKTGLVLDWAAAINCIVTKSPAYVKVDVTYTGRNAHPAEWQAGINAGAALAEAVAGIKQGEIEPGVTCNVGIMQFGAARNQIPGLARLQAELRSYETNLSNAAAANLREHIQSVAAKHGVKADIVITSDSPAYHLDKSGTFYGEVVAALAKQGLRPTLQSTYGCFDGNILAGKGMEVMMLGAGYYNPHSPDEYLNRTEFAQAFAVLQRL